MSDTIRSAADRGSSAECDFPAPRWSQSTTTKSRARSAKRKRVERQTALNRTTVQVEQHRVLHAVTADRDPLIAAAELDGLERCDAPRDQLAAGVGERGVVPGLPPERSSRAPRERPRR